jgi:glyoxylase-like metal-dependent hydrolase (beta-lactamase superfamily II)
MPDDRRLGHVTVLTGERGGKYPHGNSLLVRGTDATIVVDPSLSLIPRRGELGRVDHVLNSHAHEDHVAGNHLFPEVSWHVHEADVPGLRSLDGLMAIYGFDGPTADEWRRVVIDDFHFQPCAEPRALHDGQVFELGGVRLRVLHAPGHTRGHCLFHVEPDDVVYLGDIDLSSFGPYYGDAWSSLEDFERTLARVRDVEARWYATFHHIGVLDGRPAFLERLDRFADVIRTREARLLDFLAEPRTLDEVAAHRFVYRPTDPVPYADPVERRSMGQHVDRLVRDGRACEVAPGRYRRSAHV